MEIRIISDSAAHTRQWGDIIGQHMPAGTVIACYGDLGLGKTVFAQGLAQGLEVKEAVTSPTYIYYNEYQGRLPFCHIDAYRLELLDEEEIAQLGLGDCFLPHKTALVEWPQYLGADLPRRHIALHILALAGREDGRALLFRFDERYYPWLFSLLQARPERI